MTLLISVVWLAAVAWLIMRAVGQRGLLPSLDGPDTRATDFPHVTAIVPARNETLNIDRCIRSLLAQNYPPSRIRIIVVDDHSEDDTATIVRRIMAADSRVILLESPPLPPRWTGKAHACWIGARHSTGESDWLCFLDADVWGEPDLLARATAAASHARLDLLSLAPRQQLETFAERLMIPCGLVLLSLLQDLRRLQARDGNAVTATGQFMLIRKDAYDAAGGHAAVSSAICEDLEFARCVKKAGRAVLLMNGDGIISTRMYTGWRTLWPGFAKNLVDTLGGPATTIAVAAAAVIMSWGSVAIPLLDAADWSRGTPTAAIAFGCAMLGAGAAFGLHIAATHHFRIPFYYGLLFPIGYAVGAVMALDSVMRRFRGRVSWKGRIYS